jgi:anti-anti-sigma regulatory factor
MLRTELKYSANGLTVRLQGRLSGQDAEYVSTLVASDCVPPKELTVDLSDVTYIDARGEAILAILGRLGAKFVARDPYVTNVCERLQLAIV